MTIRRRTTFILAGALLLAPAAVLGQTEDATKILNQGSGGVVALISYAADKSGTTQGTALALAADILATSYHTISQANDVEALTVKQKKIKLEGIIGVDKAHDVVLLKLKSKIQPLNVSVAGPEALVPGARLFVLGANEAGQIVVSEGTLRRFLDIGPGERVMELSLTTSPQFSGGPILDLGGQVVGMLVIMDRIKVGIPVDVLQKVTRSTKAVEFKAWTREDYSGLLEGASFAGRTAAALDENMAARIHLEKAVKLNPSFTEGYALLAGVYDKQRDYAAAIEAYGKVTALDGTRADAFYGLGSVLRRTTKYAEAAAAYEKAISLNINNKEIHFELGDTYEALQNWAKAAEAYERYLALKPEVTWNGYLRLGICRTNLQQYDAAIAALLEARKAQPKDIKVNKSLAETYEKAGQLERAEEVYNSLAVIDAANARIYYGQARTMYEAGGKFDKAVGPAKKVIELDPKNEANHYYLGLLYFRLQRYDEATEAFRQALAIKPDLANAWFQIGSGYFQQKRYKEAADAYRRYADLMPDDPNGWLSLGVCYMYLKNYEAALEPMKRCVDLKPDNAAAQFNLGIVYVNLKDNLSARDVHKKLLTLDPALAEKLKKYLR